MSWASYVASSNAQTVLDLDAGFSTALLVTSFDLSLSSEHEVPYNAASADRQLQR